MLTYTASIGNAVLKSALSLQENYSVQDTDNHKHYINEKNRYGERPLLKKNALLLFMYLHFLNPDVNGLVRLDIEDAANALNCTERTIKNNIKLLYHRNYIITSLNPAIPGFYTIFLAEYKSYFLPANHGGRGYSIISQECFDQFVKMQDINSLRLAIRNILPAIEHKTPASHGFEKSFRDILRYLPGYMTRSKVKEILNTDIFKNMFHTKTKKRFAVIEAKDDFNPARIADALRSDCRRTLIETMDEINENSKKQKMRFGLRLTENDITDICNISLKIHIPYIIAAVREVYNDYISKNMRVQNVGALVRTIAEYKAEFLLTA